MKKHQTKKLYFTAFTLVELIVVIVILSILATIAFLSFNSYSSSSRDSVRLSDINSLNKSLELFNVNASKYPDPTNVYTRVVYSGGVIFEQGNAGDSVLTAVQKVNKKPIDPLDSTEYTYSTNLLRTSFQLKGELENKPSTGYNGGIENGKYKIENDGNNLKDISTSLRSAQYDDKGVYVILNSIQNLLTKNLLNNDYTNYNQVLADSNSGSRICYVKGNFNGLIEKTNTGNTNYILAVPGLIVNEKNNLNLDYNTLSGKVVCNGMNSPCIVTYNPMPVFIGSGNSVPTTSEDIEDIMVNLQSAYSGSNSSSTNPTISNLLNSTGTALVSLGSSVVSKVGVNTNNIINTNNCLGSINSSNAHSTATGETNSDNWKYSATPGICTWTCDNNYYWNGNSCEYMYFPGEDGIIGNSDDCDTKNIIICTEGSGTLICNSGTNKQVWSACNLGAKVAYNGSNGGTFNASSSSTRGGDDNVNGKVYQWGRNKGFSSSDTSQQSSRVAVNINSNDTYGFMWNAGMTSPYDWSQTQSGALWGGTDTDTELVDGQTNNSLRKGACPIGWHVPSMKDWRDACNSVLNTSCVNGISDSTGIFRNTLMFPFVGYRQRSNGKYLGMTIYGNYWSSSPSGTDSAHFMSFNTSNIRYYDAYYRARGYSVRCIKN